MKYRSYAERANWGQDAIVGDSMGKWAILCLNDDKLYWCYGNGGEASRFADRKGLQWPVYQGLIDTWSRDYHIYEVKESFDQASEKLGSGNIWAFSTGDFNEYGTFIRDNCSPLSHVRWP